jgi:aryl-alcohol dehydrogenase-like predicted oxidoreductase
LTMRNGTLPVVTHPIGRCVLGTSGIRNESGYRMLDHFMTAGGTYIDTAPIYGGGVSEQAVGGWIAKNNPSDLVVIGKGAHPPDCRPDAVKAELARSLDQLRLEKIDIYLLHRDDPQVPVGEWIDALEEERAAGLIDTYGGSNWSRQRMDEANAYADTNGRPRMTVLSNHFSLAEPVEPLYPGCAGISIEDGRWLTETGIVLMPWSSQARGFFSDVNRDLLDPNTWRCWDTPENRARRDRARLLAADRGVAAINVALAFVLSQPFATMPIIGPRDTDELAVALAGADIALDEAERQWLAEGPATNGRGTGSYR